MEKKEPKNSARPLSSDDDENKKESKFKNFLAKQMKKKKDKFQLGWHFLQQDSCRFMMYHFFYIYDNRKIPACFKILSDLKSLKVCDMTWDYIEEYDIYNITITEVQIGHILKNDTTGADYIEYEDIPKKPEGSRTAHDVPKTFDVTKHGEYLGMPRLKE